MNQRLMPPSSGFHNPITVNGRVYSCAANGTLDVPDFDAAVMLSNGWTVTAAGGSGATAVRPVNPKLNTQFHDTTLGKIVIWDGKNWRDFSSGAIA